MMCRHAGYRYSGETAAYAYHFLMTAQPRPKRIFVLGPSHHVALTGCAVSGASVCETPLGSLKVDKEVVSQLLQAGSAPQDEDYDDDDSDYPACFRLMSKQADEAEHSLEMQFPYIYKAMNLYVAVLL